MSNNHVHPLFSELLGIMDGKRAANQRAPHRQSAPAGECGYCDRERAKGNSFFPPHDASSRCESGKRNHCTCDVCF